MDSVGVAGAIFISAFSMYRYDASYAVEVQRAHLGCGIGSGGSWGGRRPRAACYVATDGGQGRGHHPRSAFVLAMLRTSELRR